MRQLERQMYLTKSGQTNNFSFEYRLRNYIFSEYSLIEAISSNLVDMNYLKLNKNSADNFLSVMYSKSKKVMGNMFIVSI